jgi:hypothetical protein
MQKYSIKVGKDQTEEVELNSAHKLNVGDTVNLKDGKKARIKSVNLNVSSGNYDVELDEAQDANLNATGIPRSTAEGNDPDPYRKAVKDVVLDPRFTPAVVDPTRPASEVAEEAAADVQTGGARAVTDKRVNKAPVATQAGAPRKGDAKSVTKDDSAKDAGKTHESHSADRSTGPFSMPRTGSST